MAVVSKDKMAVMQVLGSLIKEPLLLLNPQYPLEIEYFPEGFHRYLFEAIEYLIKNQASNISYIDIDNFLSKYTTRYSIFTENKGVEYIQNVQKLANTENYPYYYSVLKKMNLLNDLNLLGYDTRQIYDMDIIDSAITNKMQENFDAMEIEDIINYFKIPLNSLSSKYLVSADIQKYKAGSRAKELKEKFKQTPEMGLPLNSKKLTTIFSGRGLKKLFVKSAFQGMGKTRHSVADACLISAKEYYDIEQSSWIINEFATPTAVIVTEQEWDEIETLSLAYISQVDEDHILHNTYEEGEEERVDRAIEILDSSELFYIAVSDYNYEDIELIVTEHKQKYGITHLFFDYLHETEKLLSETGKKSGNRNLRTDQVLAMVAAKLKGLAKRLNIHLDTSTQTNDQIKSVLFADQSVIRGAKSIADKPDIGYVLVPLSKADEDFAKTQTRGFAQMPNLVYHVYKVRRGSKINKVKVWVYFDYGTLRTKDCFVTKANNELINVSDTEIQIILDSRETEVSKTREEKMLTKNPKGFGKKAKIEQFDEEDY